MKKTYFFLFALAILCAGCKPDVESCFTFSVSDETVIFNSSCSVEPESYDWDFGDGESAITANPAHTYDASGTYTVTLRVTDKKGRTNSASEVVTVVVCNPACVNGDCVAGTCQCDAGWTGPACDQ